MNHLTYKGYSAAVEYDPDDHVLFGRLAGIRDRVIFHGRSVDELEQAFRESVDGYIENCAACGRDPQRPASGRLMLRVPPHVHCAALAAARAAGESLNQWASRALERAART